jgi:DNA-binding response OmpR family regulator
VANILVIDDDDLMHDIIQNFLQQDNHHVLTASGGLEGLNLVRNNLFDLVIVDIFMPEMNGFEVINKIQLELPAIPILAISGGGSMICSNSFLKAAKKMGAFDTMTKPINFKKLKSTVSALLKDE